MRPSQRPSCQLISRGVALEAAFNATISTSTAVVLRGEAGCQLYNVNKHKSLVSRLIRCFWVLAIDPEPDHDARGGRPGDQ